jgi:hypothetical protein
MTIPEVVQYHQLGSGKKLRKIKVHEKNNFSLHKSLNGNEGGEKL